MLKTTKFLNDVAIYLKFIFGINICPRCGSMNVTTSGWPGHNLRFYCDTCGIVTRVGAI